MGNDFRHPVATTTTRRSRGSIQRLYPPLLFILLLDPILAFSNLIFQRNWAVSPSLARRTRNCKEVLNLLYASNQVDVVQRLELNEQFSRWRFLQELLEGEVEHRDANELLHCVLMAYLNSHPSQRGNGSPVLCDATITTINLVLAKDANSIPVLQQECKAADDTILLSHLESILPDPNENKDACDGIWDTVVGLHGWESVNVNRQARCKDWHARCIVARVLIWFDFLQEGVLTA